MTEADHNLSLLIFILGAIIIFVILIRSGFKRLGVPSIIGFMILGFVIKFLHTRTGCLAGNGEQIFEFLAKLGIITLLFRIGLESNVPGLLHQLRRASLIWVGGVLLSGGLGFAVCYYLVNLQLVPSLFVAIALTATSVGIPVGVWREANALKTERGELLIDVAELDDISGIVLMALLFSVVPVLRHETGNSALGLVLLKAMSLLLLKLFAFGAMCALFSIYIERHITDFFKDMTSSPDPVIVIAGIGILIAAVAGLLGFSVAIGAFFAGLVFSRDPRSVKIDTSFETLYDFFSPFFFIGVGLSIEPGSLSATLGLGLLLLVVAVFGKLFGHGLMAWLAGGWTGGVLVGVSMVPRAEITMIIIKHGKNLGNWAVPPKLFTAMVLVSAFTCILSPLVIRRLLAKWKIKKE